MLELKRIISEPIDQAEFLARIRLIAGVSLTRGDSVKLLPAPDVAAVPPGSRQAFLNMNGCDEAGGDGQFFDVGGTYILTDLAGNGRALIATLDDWGGLRTMAVPASRLEKLGE